MGGAEIQQYQAFYEGFDSFDRWGLGEIFTGGLNDIGGDLRLSGFRFRVPGWWYERNRAGPGGPERRRLAGAWAGALVAGAGPGRWRWGRGPGSTNRYKWTS